MQTFISILDIFKRTNDEFGTNYPKYVVGDLNGDVKRLIGAIEQIGKNGGGSAIFLGNILCPGSNPEEFFRLIRDFKVLMGPSESALLSYLDALSKNDEDNVRFWGRILWHRSLGNGGESLISKGFGGREQTADFFRDVDMKTIPYDMAGEKLATAVGKEVMDFIRNMPVAYTFTNSTKLSSVTAILIVSYSCHDSTGDFWDWTRECLTMGKGVPPAAAGRQYRNILGRLFGDQITPEYVIETIEIDPMTQKQKKVHYIGTKNNESPAVCRITTASFEGKSPLASVSPAEEWKYSNILHHLSLPQGTKEEEIKF